MHTVGLVSGDTLQLCVVLVDHVIYGDIHNFEVRHQGNNITCEPLEHLQNLSDCLQSMFLVW